MNARPHIAHETRHRLRLVLPAADVQALRQRVADLPGVRTVRASPRLACLVVQHDGAPATRAAILRTLGVAGGRAQHPGRRRRATPPVYWVPGLLAASVPLWPADWRRGVTLAAVAARVASQPARLREDAPAVLLDAASLAALAAAAQPGVVAASVLLRIGAERMSARLVRQADRLLEHLLPQEAAQYPVAAPGAPQAWLALAEVRPGDLLRLVGGDVVPVDGCVHAGQARVNAAALDAPGHDVAPGSVLAAGMRLAQGELVLRAESDAASSRLARMRVLLRQAMRSRDPPGALQPEPGRLVTLPLTAAALVLGLTGDTARAAAMLQSDARQGLDLALPVAREAALYALTRHGLLTGGLEAIERLACARTLVLEETGALGCGRWSLQRLQLLAQDASEAEVRGWLQRMAGGRDGGDPLCVPDPLVREWVEHGALLLEGGQEVHLASPRRLHQVWGLSLPPAGAPPRSPWLQRELAVVARGRLLARVLLASELRPQTALHLRRLAALGFGRMALFLQDDGQREEAAAAPLLESAPKLEVVTPAQRGRWLAAAGAEGLPLVLLHATLRDLVPPGSLSLTPMDAETGAHGMLLDEPLASLVAARAAAQAVQRRLRVQQGAANVLNSGLMMASALRWMPPMATTLLHHGFALLLLLDSLRLESLSLHPPGPEDATPYRSKSHEA